MRRSGEQHARSHLVERLHESAWRERLDKTGGGASAQTELECIVSPKDAVAETPSMNVEVLGSRAACDVRYQELKNSYKRIPSIQAPVYGRQILGERLKVPLDWKLLAILFLTLIAALFLAKN